MTGIKYTRQTKMKKLFLYVLVASSLSLVACSENDTNDIEASYDSQESSDKYEYTLPKFISENDELEEFQNILSQAKPYNDEDIKTKITEPIDTNLREYSNLEVSVSTTLDQQSDEDIPNSNSEIYYKEDLDPVEARVFFVLNQIHFSSNDHINELVFDKENKILHIKFNEENMGNRILGYMNGNKDDFLDYHNSEINRIKQSLFVEHGLHEYVFYLYEPIEGKHVVTTDGDFVPELPFEGDKEGSDDLVNNNSISEAEDAKVTDSAQETNNQDNDIEDNQPELIFDINSSEVHSQLIGTNSVNHEGNFEQDAITIGMTQTEVEELYGQYDFTFYYQGSAPAFYGNLAVVYSELGPYGDGDGSDASMNDIDPDENIVESVYYYAGVTEDEMIDALGEPDEHDDGIRSMNGLPYYVYQGTGDDDRYYITGASTINTPEGERIGLIMREVFDDNPNMVSDQQPVNEEDIPVTEEPDPNAEIKDEYDYEYLLTEYLQRLAHHYNYDNYDDVYYYLKRGSPAYDKIADNKASGHFTGHETDSVELVEMTDLGDGTVKLNANRVYSHDNSDGQRITNVNYIVNAETHEVLDFEGVSDEAY